MTLPIEELAGYWPEDEPGSVEDAPDLAGVLWEALDDRYADADAADVEEALDNVLASMSDAEAFSFTKALEQIGSSAGQALSNPAVGRVAGTALPVGAAALGTLIGGPAGTAIGSTLGSAAAQSLGLPASAKPSQAASASGSTAAAKALILSGQPEVLKGLLRLSMGEHGQKAVNGIPVSSIMNLLSSVFAQAAADADELLYADGEGLDADEGPCAGCHHGDHRSLYSTLMDADSYERWDVGGPL